MRKKSALIIAVCVLSIMLFTTSSFAKGWDGERQGFLLGIGFGGGYDSYSGIQYDAVGPDAHDQSTIAFAASPRIGYAVNNQLAFFYSRHPLTFSAENEAGKDVSLISCIEAVQVHYYLNDTTPSLYFGLGGGIGYFFDEPTSNYSSESLKGVGLIGTIGLEPFKHISTELSLHYKAHQDGGSDFGVSLLVNVLGY